MKYKLKEIKLEVSYKCNLMCIHCSSEASATNCQEISKDACLKIIEKSGEMGVEKIAFSGGEPLLWPHIEEAIDRVKKHAIQVVVYSSGNVDNIETILQKLKKIGADKFIFSLFGANAITHEKITLKSGSFDKTINAIRLSVQTGLSTEIHFVPLSMNHDELESVAKLAKKLGVGQLSLLRFVPQGRGGAIADQAVLSETENYDLKKRIEKLRSTDFNVRTGSPYNFLLLNNQPKCTASIDKLTIGPDLKIYPCDAFKQLTAKKVVGNSEYSDISQHNLKECWERSYYLNKVREILKASHKEPCLSCNFLKYCRSGCLAQKILHYGEMTKKPDPQCLRNLLLKKS